MARSGSAGSVSALRRWQAVELLGLEHSLGVALDPRQVPGQAGQPTYDQYHRDGCPWKAGGDRQQRAERELREVGSVSRTT